MALGESVTGLVQQENLGIIWVGTFTVTDFPLTADLCVEQLRLSLSFIWWT